MSGTELPPLPPAGAATAEDVATVAMMAELLDIELGILGVGEGIRALGGEVEDDRYGAFVVRRDHRTLQRWLARAMALRARPLPRPTKTATAPSAARRETRTQPTATDPGGGAEDGDPPSGGPSVRRPVVRGPATAEIPAVAGRGSARRDSGVRPWHTRRAWLLAVLEDSHRSRYRLRRIDLVRPTGGPNGG